MIVEEIMRYLSLGYPLNSKYDCIIFCKLGVCEEKFDDLLSVINYIIHVLLIVKK